MSSKTVLVVEDDRDIREMLAFSLQRASYSVVETESAEQALDKLGVLLPDIILVDWMLPGMEGPELVRRIRLDELTRDIPVIMLTARGEEADKLRGFDNGADDYLTKPFSPKELMARMKALMRRSSNDDGGVLQVKDMSLDMQAHRLIVARESVDVGPTEFKLLEFFMRHQDRVYSREQLLDLVWGRNVYVEERTVDVHILRLRKLLAPFGYDSLVQTVRGAGYRFSVK
ncbi:MAG TPA: phosphate regulon transcriptional regulator PhoB [Gammaproteobacteria bacterium]|jgi:two-component system, OmpR family, phosphate regulon response regulator PhoB|nr:phosphate regulon transcriptional regulator PhoB [Gammaproteobacteria bacterium]